MKGGHDNACKRAERIADIEARWNDPKTWTYARLGERWNVCAARARAIVKKEERLRSWVSIRAGTTLPNPLTGCTV